MKRYINIELDSEVYDKLSEIAKSDGRKVTNYVKHLITKNIETNNMNEVVINTPRVKGGFAKL